MNPDPYYDPDIFVGPYYWKMLQKYFDYAEQDTLTVTPTFVPDDEADTQLPAPAQQLSPHMLMPSSDFAKKLLEQPILSPPYLALYSGDPGPAPVLPAPPAYAKKSLSWASSQVFQIVNEQALQTRKHWRWVSLLSGPTDPPIREYHSLLWDDDLLVDGTIPAAGSYAWILEPDVPTWGLGFFNSVQASTPVATRAFGPDNPMQIRHELFNDVLYAQPMIDVRPKYQWAA